MAIPYKDIKGYTVIHPIDKNERKRIKKSEKDRIRVHVTRVKKKLYNLRSEIDDNDNSNA